ncbi:hypothetical protein BUALT_Bualt01G0198500 [Buddleja alternifolia]|uniref:Retrotransposon gag domain-containing protein n=1 Tax=Buddleja alternifolia TaxID=168488 RepID=A0AAV6YEF1_9LAMI|nr:hypothetical protein BUALT_Bualt01G0198500 [Buddleja alternifolia]
MADGTRSMEMRRELDGFKEQMEKSIADLKDMIAVVANSVQNNQGGTSGAANIGDDMAEEPGGEHVHVDDTPPDAKVKIAAVHLEGKALQWHQIFMKNRLTREVPQWGEYVRALNDRFGALLYEDPMSELVNLKQTESIQDYLDRFDELMNCVDLFEPYAISCFLGGLKSEVAIHWLVTLGDINWNLKELKMVFYIGGQKVSLRGKQPPTVETVSNKKMRKHLHNPAQVAMMQVGVFATAQEEESSCLQIEEYENTTTGWLNDEKLQGIIHKLIDDPDSKPKYEWKEGLLTRKGRLAQRNNRAITQVLVKWFNAPEEDSTWENLHELRLRFPAFNP